MSHVSTPRFNMVLRKDELEVQLKDEHQLIQDGVLRDDSPLDSSSEFQKLCNACRIGDLKGCQEAIATGVNINARDHFDYTPLILVSSTRNISTSRVAPEGCRADRTSRLVSAGIMKPFSSSSKLVPSANEIPFRASGVSIMR